jgi:hypothetical protein
MNDDWIIVVAALMILDRLSRKKSKKYVHSRYRKSFFNSLDSPERRVRQRKIPRCCLQSTSASAWRKLYEAGNDQAMMTLTGFDCASFVSLLLLLHLSSTLTHHLFPLELLALNGRSIHRGEGSKRYSQKTALDLFLHGRGQGDR